MLISRYELQVSPELSITRTEDGVSLSFSYDLSGSQEETGEWVWDGSILSELGDDEGGTTQMADRPMSLTYTAELEDGVTETGSYEITDAGDQGISQVFDFDITVFSEAATYEGTGALSHFVFGSDEGDELTGADGSDVLHGGLGHDTINGGTGDDRLYGGAGSDKLTGGDGDDIVRGGGGDDTLTGGEGDDKIVGGAGKNDLTGGAGADTFVFKGEVGAQDTIRDFVSGEDLIRLDGSAFTGLAHGALGDGVFVANATGEATDAVQRLVYDTTDGSLFYDADGSGVGAAVLIAKLGAGVALSADDIGIF